MNKLLLKIGLAVVILLFFIGFVTAFGWVFNHIGPELTMALFFGGLLLIVTHVREEFDAAARNAGIYYESTAVGIGGFRQETEETQAPPIQPKACSFCSASNLEVFFESKRDGKIACQKCFTERQSQYLTKEAPAVTPEPLLWPRPGPRPEFHPLQDSGLRFTVTEDNIIDMIVDLSTFLDDYNLPETGRLLCLPDWALKMLARSLETLYISRSMTGPVGGRMIVDRMQVYPLPTDSTGSGELTQIKFGNAGSFPFLAQIAKGVSG